MNATTRIQLSIMMFLQFVVWGAWYGQLSKYLFAINFTGAQVGNIYATFSIAMLISPFVVGMLADRFFNAERVLGVLNLLGAAILYMLTQITDYDTFYWTMLLYCLTFAPTNSSAIPGQTINVPGIFSRSIIFFITRIAVMFKA